MTMKDMNDDENDELFEACIQSLQENRLEDAIYYPTRGLLNPSQIPHQRDFISQPPHPLNRPLSTFPGSSNFQIPPQRYFTSPPLHISNRPLYPFPGSSSLQIPKERDFTSQPPHLLNRPLSPFPRSSSLQIPKERDFTSQPPHLLNRPLCPFPGSSSLQIPKERDFTSQPPHLLNRPLPPYPGSTNLQLPQQRDLLSQALNPFSHPLFPLPGASYLKPNYLLHPNSLPDDDLIFNPPSPINNFQYQLSAGDEENIYHIIIQEHESRQLINKVRYLKDSNIPESKIQIKYIIQGLASNPISLCLSACNRVGSYALQQLIKIIKKSIPEMSQLTSALSIMFRIIACDLIGRHVILKCFKKLSLCDNKILYIEMGKHCLSLATDEVGCALLNDCIPLMCTTYKNPILEQIAFHCQSLAQDCYGTYVVQQAITNQHPIHTPMIVNKLRVIMLNLSTQKAGSHLVEKCLKYSSTKHVVMEELVELNTLQLRDLACHEYGNFVIQQAISPIQDGESSMVQDLTRTLRKNLYPILKDLQAHKIGRNVYKRYKETQQMPRAVRDPRVDF